MPTLRILLAGLALAAPAAAAGRLNVLLITADDLGLQLSCYGETVIRTPHLDKLAASGTRFEVAYVAAASCSPSRSAMFTGLHTYTNGQLGLAHRGFSMHPGMVERAIPNVLKKAGYITGIIGKLHVAPEKEFRFDYRPRVNPRDMKKITQAAKGFMASERPRPFFLMVNYADPHVMRDAKTKTDFPVPFAGLPKNPIEPGPKTIFDFQQVDTPRQRARTAGYYNVVKRLDDGVGMLMGALERSGRADDTLVIFLGDHGPPFCRGKTSCYEAGLRVPFLVRWPGVSKPMASKAMVSAIDILPTVLDATGVKPAGAAHGRSLRPAVSDPNAAWREYLVGEYHFHGQKPFYPRRAIRDGRYKLIHNLLAGKAKAPVGVDGDPAYRFSRQPKYDGTAARRAFNTYAKPPEFELYDLKNDPIEFQNLAGRPEWSEVQQRLTKALRDYRVRTGDPFLKPAHLEKFVTK